MHGMGMVQNRFTIGAWTREESCLTLPVCTGRKFGLALPSFSFEMFSTLFKSPQTRVQLSIQSEMTLRLLQTGKTGNSHR